MKIRFLALILLAVLQVACGLSGKPALPAGSSIDGYRLINIIPTDAGDAPITLPAACGALEEAVISGYPMMSDAEMVVKIPPNQGYQTRHDLAEVQAFYEQEMAAAGWALTNTHALGPLAELTFTKDGKSVRITLVQTGKIVAVTITDL